MGTWGTAIYSNDLAMDVRDACRDVFAFYDIEKGNEIIFSEFKEIINQSFIDNEYASFWYALADWQWNNGRLTDSVKTKTLELLDVYAGIDEWISAGNEKDAEKRRCVLDTLKQKLLSTQKPYKKLKSSLKRPKHKPGDIIIFRPAVRENPESGAWKIKSLSWPIWFESSKYLDSKYEDIIDGYNAQGKYMAILCVGSVKEEHSQHVENVFDEYSLYVWYDYISETKPTLDTLKSCGFLPQIVTRYKNYMDFNKRIFGSIDWEYTFALYCERFRIDSGISEFHRLEDLSDVERFNSLFSKKQYSSDYCGSFDLYNIWSGFFEEKYRIESVGDIIDNLLDPQITNPQLASPEKAVERRELLLQRDEVYRKIKGI